MKIKQNKKPGWQQREREYNEWLRSIGADIKTKKRPSWEYETYVPAKGPYIRDVPQHPSRSTPHENLCPKQDSRRYTGEYIVGIATMHKSNLVAVGAADAPSNYSTMRRN